MKLSNFYAVQALVTKLIDVEARLKAINTDGRLGVTVDGKYQDASVIEAVRPILNEQLAQEKFEIEQKLHHCGVEIDC